MKEKYLRGLALALVGAMAVGNSVVPTGQAAAVKVKKVAVSAPSGKTAYVAKGKKISLTTKVTVTPNKSANKAVRYVSANKKIATVTDKGVVKGVKAGNTKITVISSKNSKKSAVIKVVVKKSAVTKVALNKKKAAIAVGGKVTLKPTITPASGCYNKVAWTTSKKSVATVSKSGVVKGVKEGTATITATSLDGSNKKATCKVTVGTGISKLELLDDNLIKVTLTAKAEGLKEADFSVLYKETKDGKYQTTVPIKRVYAMEDAKVYMIDTATPMYGPCYLQVTIDSLKVNKSKEIYKEYTWKDSSKKKDTIRIVSGKSVGDSYNATWSLMSEDIGAVGTGKRTVTGLPDGLKAYYPPMSNNIEVKGHFTKICDGQKAVFTVEDEKGNVFTRTYVFYVGDDKNIVCSALDRKELTYIPAKEKQKPTDAYEAASGYNLDGKEIASIGQLSVSGGSGEYVYEVKGLPTTVESVSAEGEVKADGKKATTAGTYKVEVTIKDAKEPTIKKDVSFQLDLLDGIVATGTVKDKSGAVMPNVNVKVWGMEDEYEKFFSASTLTGLDGNYRVRVLPGDYFVGVEFADDNEICYADEFFNDFSKEPAVANITTNLYRATFTGVPNATAYDLSSDYLMVYNASTGESYDLNVDSRTHELFAYLPEGTYEFSPVAKSTTNIVKAYSKYRVSEGNEMGDYDAYGQKITSLVEDDFLGLFKLTGENFVVDGAKTITVNAKAYAPSTASPIPTNVPVASPAPTIVPAASPASTIVPTASPIATIAP